VLGDQKMEEEKKAIKNRLYVSIDKHKKKQHTSVADQ